MSSPWPPELAGTPAVSVIDAAIARHRLGHSLLLHGEDPDTLVAVANAIADRLLNPAGTPESSHRGIAEGRHPDCFVLRPTGKMRQISADATREFIGVLQMSPTVGARKVGIVHEADRMNTAAANIFLKTLEEPPASTTLLLLTTHPYALLPTIRSRCLHFKFAPPKGGANLSAEASLGEGKGDSPPTSGSVIPGGPAWLADYRAWLGRLVEGAPDKRAVADHIFTLYGLIARFGMMLDNAAAAAWTRQKESLAPDIDEDEQIAIETGIGKGLRSRFFTEIEQATLDFARPRLAAGDEPARRAFTAAIDKLEHGTRLLRVNLNESAALEDFLLSSLRLWSKR